MFLLVENNIRGGVRSGFGDIYVKSEESKKIFNIHVIILFGWAMGQSLLFDETKFHKHVQSEEIKHILDDSNIDCFVVCNLSCPDDIKAKNKETSILS